LRIGILTSGGDAPGMNAAVRAVARTAFFKGWDVMGIWSGYKGLLEGRIYPMDRRRLGGIIHRGGTVLGTERSAEFATPEGQRKAAGKLAEAAVVPEFEPSPENLLLFIKKAFEQGKSHFVVVVAEGAPVSAEELDEYVNGAEGTYDSRLTVVGHIQRGGIPTASDRILASRLGSAAVEALAEGESGMMVALRGTRVKRVPLKDVVGKGQPLAPTSTGWPRSWPSCRSKQSGTGYMYIRRQLIWRTTCRREVLSGSRRGRRTARSSAASPRW
jgi:6-phosphofructokinase